MQVRASAHDSKVSSEPSIHRRSGQHLSCAQAFCELFCASSHAIEVSSEPSVRPELLRASCVHPLMILRYPTNQACTYALRTAPELLSGPLHESSCIGSPWLSIKQASDSFAPRTAPQLLINLHGSVAKDSVKIFR